MVRRYLSLPAFRLLTGVSTRLERRLTAPGRLVALGMVVAGLFSIDTTRTQAFQIFSLFCALLILGFLFTWRIRRRFVVARTVPRHATIGQVLDCSVTVDNPHAGDQGDLLLVEFPPVVVPTLQEFRVLRQPGEERRNWFDRRVAFHRYLWIIRRKQGFSGKAVPLPRIPGGGQCRVSLPVVPNRRGRLILPGPTLLRPDPLGLVLAFQRHPQPASVLVLPKRHPLPAGFQLPGNRRHQPGGVNMAAAVGEAEEFVSLREYREGDSPRRIHWPGLARYGKMLVREYQEEYFTRYGLILDTFLPPGQSQELFEEAVSLAASFSTVVESGDSLLELLFVGNQSYHFTAGRGMAHAEQILEILAGVDHNSRDSFHHLTGLVLSQPAVLCGCVVILLAWDEARRELVKKLDQRSLPLLVLVVTSADAPAVEPLALSHASSRMRAMPLGRVGQTLAAGWS